MAFKRCIEDDYLWMSKVLLNPLLLFLDMLASNDKVYIFWLFYQRGQPALCVKCGHHSAVLSNTHSEAAIDTINQLTK